MQEILVDKEGYKQFFDELEKIKMKLLSNASSGSEAYKDAVGDGWHDNFAFEEVMREERTIASRIDKMLKEEKHLKVINTPKYDEHKVNIGDVVEVFIKYDEQDTETDVFKLTGKYIPDTNGYIKEVSLNSPLGKAIYRKRISDKFSYNVGNKVVEVEILNKKTS